MAADESEWMKLPTDEKCVHKAWKARMAGYEEATKLFARQPDEKSPEFLKYLSSMKKFVTDGNAIAQEKALDAVLVYIENAACAGKTGGEVCSGVVAKCLNSSRVKTKEKGVEILMMFIEIEKHDIVQEELLKGLANKQPKIVAACVQCLRVALRDFGPKVIQLKPLVKQIARLLEDRDKGVREEGKQLVVEIHRWIGAALQPQLSNLKPVQLTELETEFQQLPPGKAKQTRFLRSQQELKAKMEEEAVANDDEGGDDDDGEGDQVDAYDLLDPVAILNKLPTNFYDKLEATKWQERKEMLDLLQKLLEAPKLQQADYFDLVKALRVVINKDKNVMLVTIAIKCICCLANGLRKKFSTYAVSCVDVLLEKYKEKKATVLAALNECIDAVYQTTSLEPISELCLAALGHKTPSVKAATAAFLARCFSAATPVTLPKKLLKLFATPLTKTVTDTDPQVREASFTALGTAMKVVGEKPLAPFLADIDSLKMSKIKECCENAVLVHKGKAVKSSGPSKPAATAAAPAATTSAPAVTTKKAVKKKKAAPSAKGKKTGAATEETLENVLSDETIEEKMVMCLSTEVLTNLASSNWKQRLEAIEKCTEVVSGLSNEEMCTQAFVRTITKKPGLKDTNFQVLKLKIDLLTTLASRPGFTRRSAMFCLAELVDKIGDLKNGMAVHATLVNIAEATSLEYVSEEVMQMAFEQKNPKNQSESLVWLAQAIKDFGFKVNVKPIIAGIKKGLAATNPTIRSSAMNLLGVVYMYMGAPLRTFFDSEKPALLQQIDALFEKVSGEKPPKPTRGLGPSSGGGGGDRDSVDGGEEDDEEEGDGPGGDGGFNVADLVPRTDISEKLTDALLTEMRDRNWKVRNEALQKVTAILNDAKFITPQIGALPDALAARMTDANKNLIITTLTISQTLFTAMGPNIRTHAKTFGSGIISCLGDSKTHVRAHALTTLKSLVEQGGLAVLIESETISEQLTKENPFLRTELLGFLSEQLPTAKKLPTPELDSCTPFVYACLEDRNVDVRKKAQDSLLPLMVHLGYEKMARRAGKLKQASKDSVQALLDKTRTQLPAKPSKTSRPAPAAAAPTPSAVSVPSMQKETAVAPPGGEKPAARSASASSVAKGRSKATPAGKKAAATNSSKKDQQEAACPPLKVSDGKVQRFKDEKNLKLLKWNFSLPRQEFVDQIHQQMEPSFSKPLIDQLFHADFKMHIKAMDVLIKACDADNMPATIANLDLILKWLTLRFYDTNTSVLLKAVEYLRVLFSALGENDFHLSDIEANSFVPYLMMKVGDPKDNVRRDIRHIIKLICKLYPASKVFIYVMEGLKAKNSKQRTECLEELGCLIEVYGMTVCQPSAAQALKAIAQQISSRDNSVRSAALNTIVSAYQILGDNVYKYIGSLNDKDQSMLDERIKRSAKNRPASSEPQVGAPPAAVAETTKSTNSAKNSGEPTTTRGRASMGKPGATSTPPVPADLLGLKDDGWDGCPPPDPQLSDIDLGDLLTAPVRLPSTWLRTSKQNETPAAATRSSDVKSAIDHVISQATSLDISICIQALKQIDEILSDNEKTKLFAQQHVDQFLAVAALQLRMAYTHHMNSTTEIDGASVNVIRLYQCLLGSLLAVFQKRELVRDAGRDVLKDLMQNLVTVLLDSRLNDLADGPQLIRSINLFLVKVVEKANHTNTISALIKLLHESVSNETSSSSTFLEVIMKCLWRMVRMLPTIIDDLQMDCVLHGLHLFLTAYPSHTWRARSNDLPLRTVKTILHSLAKLKGNKIMSHLSLIESSGPQQTSEVESYLQKVLRSGDTAGGWASSGGVSSGGGASESGGVARVQQQNGGDVAVRESTCSKRLSRSTHDLLAEIFEKVGSKENTREGLNDLYDFKLRFPETDLEPFLRKSSTVFQNYIQRGLKNIEVERANAMSSSGGGVKSSVPVLHSSSVPQQSSDQAAVITGDKDLVYYVERLKELRIRCGLDDPNAKPAPSQPAGGGPIPKAVDSTDAESTATSSCPKVDDLLKVNLPETSTSNPSGVADLKRRLDKIKQQNAAMSAPH